MCVCVCEAFLPGYESFEGQLLRRAAGQRSQQVPHPHRTGGANANNHGSKHAGRTPGGGTSGQKGPGPSLPGGGAAGPQPTAFQWTPTIQCVKGVQILMFAADWVRGERSGGERSGVADKAGNAPTVPNPP